MEKVCLVIGAGAGIGGTVAKKFASDGYYAYLARRTDEEGLNRLIKEIEDAGGKASGSLLNVIEESSIEDLVNKIESFPGVVFFSSCCIQGSKWFVCCIQILSC